jgi:thymidylate synthase
MNTLDKQYQQLLKSILDFGVEKSDRTGTGTKSIFGYTIRHKMSHGFPILTTKKVHFKSVATELIWFLRGDTNIKYLVDNDCNIWNGDAYKKYLKGGNLKWLKPTEVDTPIGKMSIPIPYSQEEFINKIKTDDEFAKKWGLKIEERELSRNERSDYYYKNGNSEGIVVGSLDRPIFEEDEVAHKWYDEKNVPTKLITITYNDKTIESYE